MLTQCASNPRVQPNELKVAAHQFQPAVGSELFVTELDRKLSLDRPPQPPYLQPHLWGLSCRLELRCCRTPNDAPEAPFLRSNRRIHQNYFRFRVKSQAISQAHNAGHDVSVHLTPRDSRRARSSPSPTVQSTSAVFPVSPQN